MLLFCRKLYTPPICFQHLSLEKPKLQVRLYEQHSEAQVHKSILTEVLENKIVFECFCGLECFKNILMNVQNPNFFFSGCVYLCVCMCVRYIWFDSCDPNLPAEVIQIYNGQCWQQDTLTQQASLTWPWLSLSPPIPHTCTQTDRHTHTLFHIHYIILPFKTGLTKIKHMNYQG